MNTERPGTSAQRDITDKARAFDSRQMAQRIAKIPVPAEKRFAIPTLFTHLQVEVHHTFWIESQPRTIKPRQARSQQSCAHHQHQRQRHLQAHQNSRQPAPLFPRRPCQRPIFDLLA